MKGYSCAILYHNYYSTEGIQEVKDRIRLLDGNILFMCSVADKLKGEELIQSENEKFLFASNVGKDLGGKLLLIDLFLKLKQDAPFLIFLHDKRSYHKESGDFEKENLFSVLDKDKFIKIQKAFEVDSQLGIACGKGALRNEYNKSNDTFNTPNSNTMKELIKKYSLTLSDYSFVAGTMFWVRTSIVKNFFSQYSPAEIRMTLENGNVLDHFAGTVTHSWERVLSWIATGQGYKLREF